ncbi:FtsX-like permease family protein [Frankia sp. Cas3]|uniref:FtsX-like permease family protein n=1 Tax=Frankia sp. Cas3 TaxID=3073926 RepID=UPI002AD202E2|nr:FtsX-like permease family protein [Frankia sp. Cas3]
MLSIAAATLRARWVAFASSLVALTLGVCVIATMTLVLVTAAEGSSYQRAQRFAAVPEVIQAEAVLHVQDRYGTTEAVALPEQPEIPASVVARFPAATPDRTFYAQVLGDPADEVGHGWSSAAFAPYTLISGRPPVADDEIVLTHPGRLGARLTVLTHHGARQMIVAGIARPSPAVAGAEHPLFLSDAEAARLSPGVDALVPDDPQTARRAAAVPGLRVLTGAARHQADPHALQDAMDLTALVTFLGIATLLSGCVCAYLTASALGRAVAQRRRELALLRTVGATPGQVMRLVCAEALLVGALGSAAGCLLGLVAGPSLAAWMARHGLAPREFSVHLTARCLTSLTLALLGGIAITLCSVILASARAGRIHPLQALIEATDEPTSIALTRWLPGAALLLIGSGTALAIVYVFPNGAADLKTDITLTLLTVGGTSLLAPVFLRPLAHLTTWPLRRHPSAVTTLIRADLLAKSRRAAAVVGPVLITVGLTATVLGATGTATAAQSNEARSQAASARFVVLPSETPGLTDQLLATIHTVPGVDATAVTQTRLLAYQPALTSLHLEAPVPIPVSAIGVDTADALTLPLRSGSFKGLNDQTVALDTSWHKQVGNQINIWRADGTPASLRVIGVFTAGLSGPQMVVSPRNAGSSMPDRMYIRLRPHADPRTTLTALRAAANPTGATVTTTAAWTAAQVDKQAEQNRLGLIVLLGIAGAYSTLALANAFVIWISGRTRELGLLRLNGATRGQIFQIISLEASLLAAIGIMLAGAVTVANLLTLHSAIHRLVPDIPLILPMRSTATIAGVMVLVALFASLVPSWLILRSHPERDGVRA